MSILIKGMEMPKGCWTCFARRDVDIGVGIADGCDLLKAMICNPGERLDDCPIVELPPHGRLIDADALMIDVRKHSESYFADDFAHEWVDRQPTIIPAEKEGE